MYIFNHIPKTGGASMYRLLGQLIGQERLSPHLKFNEEVRYEVSAADYEKYFVIYGHLGVIWNDIVGPGRRWMTILRDPVERVLSQYYYWRNMVPRSPHLPHVNGAQTLSLGEFVRSRDYMALQANENVQTWCLADDLRLPYRKLAPSDALGVAKQHLAERFAFIGIAEDYAGSVQRLCRLLEVPYPESIPMENRTLERKARHEIEPGVIAAIEELNTMDQALYEYGKGLADSALRR
jgi:hypothetical protein